MIRSLPSISDPQPRSSPPLSNLLISRLFFRYFIHMQIQIYVLPLNKTTQLVVYSFFNLSCDLPDHFI